ncbi:MAG: hypothetical protein JWQ34_1045 [Mucilaginibacter sp.]|uniref:hypothetical protein n=1 Tax=Mucilaginibacter sp. TaxID=1882438 RepID=UPI002618617A|nr:hypothetical protein [Mucilaginibacter sp.]MDB5002820.1 hypothetical protein [Mucilaginibacter sp.]
MTENNLPVNTTDNDYELDRRHFLKIMGITTVGLPLTGFANFNAQGVSFVVDPNDAIAVSASVQWAIDELETALKAQGVAIQHCASIDKAISGNLCIPIAAAKSAMAKPLLKKAGANIPAVPEAMGLVPAMHGVRPILIATGHDERGVIYSLLELTDRINCSASPLSSIHLSKPIIEQPLNKVRSINRMFCSDVEDKPWYNDHEMWPQYLTMLATQRFNCFNLSLGLGYDFLTGVTDAYFLFAYPFLLSVPGYNVRVPQLPDAERDQNLKMLKFISEQTVARGMNFNLGIWMHGYQWIKAPNANYTIEGLTKETHAAYCRDAISLLLKECPNISGVTLRIHGESGVTEGSYDFWKTIFSGVANCGRVVPINLHAKGLDPEMLNNALSSGVPISISPKYWMEHLGMPYMQADIREPEIPKPNKKTSKLMNLSEGSRSFTRYSYGDFMKEDKKYEVVHRIWPGSQRFLLWGDPVMGAAQSRAFSFCGSSGVDLMDPLSFKGRRGSGIPGDRCAYEDVSLRPRWDWEKYLYSLRIFGRTLYNPDTDNDVWQRYLRKNFGGGAPSAQQALASATCILPTVLTAHGESAANNAYWPEMYTNMSIVAVLRDQIGDTPSPHVFGAVSPADPQLFLSINDFAKELVTGKHSGKYTPLEVAQWLYDAADIAESSLHQASVKAINKTKPEYRRWAVDITMQVGLGRFFATKFVSAVLYNIYEQTGDRVALEASLKEYKAAREHWVKLANTAKGVYMKDVTAGENPWLRGHWLDRLPGIDKDVDRMSKILDDVKPNDTRQPVAIMAVNACLNRTKRAVAKCSHVPLKTFTPGSAVNLNIMFDKMPASAKLYYRHVNMAERHESVEMKASGNSYTATISAAYTQSPYPLEYYFELEESPKSVILYPGFNELRNNQPYFVIRRT